MKVIAINGSPHKDGCTAKYVKQLDVPVVHLTDGIELAIDAVLSAHNVAFATPVNWFNVSSLMKQLIDTLPEAPKFPCEGKTAYLVAVCNEDGGQQAINQMFAPLSHMGFQFPPFASLYLNTSASESEDDWQRRGPAYLRHKLLAKPRIIGQSEARDAHGMHRKR